MSITHWLVVVGVIMVLFGRNTISRTAQDLGDAIKPLHKGMREEP